MFKNRFEFAIFGMIAALAVIDLILIANGPMQVDWAGYLPGVSFSCFLFALGQFYRHIRKDERLASTLIGTGGFIAFTLVASVLNYLLLPLKFPRIDEQLLALDAYFGYSWATMVLWAAEYPTLSTALRHVYFSSLPQLIIIVLVLGFTGRLQALWEFLAVGVLSVMNCMGFWFFFPSFGPTTVMSLPPEVVSAANLGVTPAYGAELMRLAEYGETLLTPSKVLGLIAFPSFHTVMALMAVCYLWQMRYLRWPAILLNLLMVPAILIHGGHYAVDLVAGLAVFLFTLWIVKRFISTKTEF